MADFHVGQQVVCVFPGPWLDWPERVALEIHPHKGRIYTINGIFECPFRADVVGFHLVEEPGPRVWTSDCFRPVRKTSISDFEKLLLTKDVREPENV